MTNRWICLEVSTLYHHGDIEAVARSIKRIFDRDLKEIRFVCNDILLESGAYYCFVLCLHYQNHVHDLKESLNYYRVVPSCENPNWLTTSEVDKFIASVQASLMPNGFFPGDLIQVREGYLKNLYGLVVRKAESKKYRVSFRFHLRRFMESLPATSMKVIDNVFKFKKFPVSRKSLKRSARTCQSS